MERKGIKFRKIIYGILWIVSIFLMLLLLMNWRDAVGYAVGYAAEEGDIRGEIRGARNRDRLLAVKRGVKAEGKREGNREGKKDRENIMEEQAINEEYARAYFGTGCFWCTEAIYERVEGVLEVSSGYAGGTVESPTYEMVIRGDGNHAEVVEILYNAKRVGYEKLLEVFWETHDPTTLNRQGNDVGPQYRSIILYKTEKERALAEKSRNAAQEAIWGKKEIVTQITKLKKFYKAEEYHQNYYRDNATSNPYCFIVIGPKLRKFKKRFRELLKKEYERQ